MASGSEASAVRPKEAPPDLPLVGHPEKKEKKGIMESLIGGDNRWGDMVCSSDSEELLSPAGKNKRKEARMVQKIYKKYDSSSMTPAPTSSSSDADFHSVRNSGIKGGKYDSGSESEASIPWSYRYFFAKSDSNDVTTISESPPNKGLDFNDHYLQSYRNNNEENEPRRQNSNPTATANSTAANGTTKPKKPNPYGNATIGGPRENLAANREKLLHEESRKSSNENRSSSDSNVFNFWEKDERAYQGHSKMPGTQPQSRSSSRGANHGANQNNYGPHANGGPPSNYAHGGQNQQQNFNAQHSSSSSYAGQQQNTGYGGQSGSSYAGGQQTSSSYGGSQQKNAPYGNKQQQKNPQYGGQVQSSSSYSGGQQQNTGYNTGTQSQQSAYSQQNGPNQWNEWGDWYVEYTPRAQSFDTTKRTANTPSTASSKPVTNIPSAKPVASTGAAATTVNYSGFNSSSSTAGNSKGGNTSKKGAYNPDNSSANTQNNYQNYGTKSHNYNASANAGGGKDSYASNTGGKDGYYGKGQQQNYMQPNQWNSMVTTPNYIGQSAQTNAAHGVVGTQGQNTNPALYGKDYGGSHSKDTSGKGAYSKQNQQNYGKQGNNQTQGNYGSAQNQGNYGNNQYNQPSFASGTPVLSNVPASGSVTQNATGKKGPNKKGKDAGKGREVTSNISKTLSKTAKKRTNTVDYSLMNPPHERNPPVEATDDSQDYQNTNENAGTSKRSRRAPVPTARGPFLEDVSNIPIPMDEYSQNKMLATQHQNRIQDQHRTQETPETDPGDDDDDARFSGIDGDRDNSLNHPSPSHHPSLAEISYGSPGGGKKQGSSHHVRKKEPTLRTADSRSPPSASQKDSSGQKSRKDSAETPRSGSPESASSKSPKSPKTAKPTTPSKKDSKENAVPIGVIIGLVLIVVAVAIAILFSASDSSNKEGGTSTTAKSVPGVNKMPPDRGSYPSTAHIPQKPLTPDLLLAEAINDFRNGRLNNAKEKFRDVLSNEKSAVVITLNAILGQSSILLQRNQFVEAELLLEQTGTIMPDALDWVLTEQLRINHAFALAAQGKSLDNARNILEAALARVEAAARQSDVFLLPYGELIAILNNTLGYLWFTKDQNRSLVYFLESAKRSERNPYAWNNAGVMAIMLGDLPKSVKTLSHAINLAQARPDVAFPPNLFANNLIVAQQLRDRGKSDLDPNLGLYYYNFAV